VTASFHYDRVVDLSRPLTPGAEQHPWFRYVPRIESIVADPEAVPPEGRWYVVTQIELSGHAGTHVEAPLHAVEGGADVGMVDVHRFYGEGVILDLSDAPFATAFDETRLRAAADRAGGIRLGDIVFFRFDWDRRANGDYPPFPTPEALSWLVDRQIKLLGIDSPGLEVRGNRALPNHRILFERGIPLIESLVHLEDLRESRVIIFAQPLPAFGTDAIPLRVMAFE
jgi:arylformamidase